MLLIQMTGLSGAGKTTLSYNVQRELQKLGCKTEVIDGDEYRAALGRDLGFSREDRYENIRRLGFVGKILTRNGVVVFLAAVNPYREIRRELKENGGAVKTVWIDCDLETLRARDTKGLYRRAFLPENHPDKLHNLTGVNDPFEIPTDADLIIKTGAETIAESTEKLLNFVLKNLRGEEKEKTAKALFIGRWQPFHNGHKWLVEQKLNRKIPVLIAVRDVEPDEKNPLTTAQTIRILQKFYEGEDVEIISVSNIESVNFGRKVGYEINEFSPPPEIGSISATDIRNDLRNKSDDWKKNVDEKIHDLIIEYLG